MTFEEHYRLSFYQPVAELGGREHVKLTRHAESGMYYVRKELTDYNRGVYEQLRNLDSPYFPHIYEVVQEEEKLIIIEEYIPRETLEAYAAERGTLTLEQLKPIMVDVCQALKLLHAQKPPIIHRDIKPSNLILAADGHWKLIDFNTARYYESGAQHDTTFLGTREFAAPEQFGDLQTDVRTDIYELGAMMNYLLTGKNHKKYMSQGIAQEIIQKCTQFDPARRYQSVDALMKEIQKLPERFPVEKTTLSLEKRQTYRHNHNKKDRRPFSGREGISGDGVSGWRKWLPPGFRTLKLWKMCVAGLVYAFALYISITLEVTNGDGSRMTGTALLANRIGCWLLFFVLVLFWFNYGGMHRILPFVRKPQIVWKILGYVVWSCVIFMVIMTGVVLLSS